MSKPVYKIDDLARLFRKAAARDYRHFPALLDALVVSLDETLIYVSPAAADAVSKNPALIREKLAARTAWMKRNVAVASAGIDVIAGQKLKHVSLAPQLSPAHRYLPATLPARMDIITVFDHEIGHYVARHEKLPGPGIFCHVRECAADAYACLRHVQRFGMHTGIFETGMANMALNVTLGTSENHYTSKIFHAVAALGAKKIKALSPDETATLAGNIAMTHAIDPSHLRQVYLAFAPARRLYRQTPQNWHAITTAIVDVMRAHKNNADVFLAGKYSLTHPGFKELITAADAGFISGNVTPPPKP